MNTLYIYLRNCCNMKTQQLIKHLLSYGFPSMGLIQSIQGSWTRLVLHISIFFEYNGPVANTIIHQCFSEI